jgi:carboxyl-terminal processing protease
MRQNKLSNFAHGISIFALICALTLSTVAWAQPASESNTTPNAPKDKEETLESNAPPAAPEVTQDTYKQLNLFSEIFDLVRRDYVRPVTDKKLVESAVSGMLTALDPHSAYMDAEEFKNLQIETRGEFGGLGIEVTMDQGAVKVVSPIDDTPAAKAGLKPNDLIVAIDAQPVMGLSLTEAVQKLRGKPQSKVTLGIARNHQEPFDVTLTRDIIRIKSVRSAMKGDVGYLRITQFNEQTTENAIAAIKKFQKDKGAKLKGIILDLRNNPGGLLDQSISVAGLFLDKDSVVVSTKARHPEDNESFSTDSEPLVPKNLPIVVLINAGSASASEIVAGALQDHKRATLMGTQSFGKGSVQTVIPVPGYGGVRLTTALYYTPSGRSIQATGIKPNIIVKQKGEKEGFTFHEADLHGAIDNPNGKKSIRNTDLGEAANDNKTPDKAPEDKPMDSERDKTKDESVSSQNFGDEKKDYQLQQALELVGKLAANPKAAVLTDPKDTAPDAAADKSADTDSGDNKKE